MAKKRHRIKETGSFSRVANPPLLLPRDFIPVREIQPIVPLSGWTPADIMGAIDQHDAGQFGQSELLYHAMTKEPRIGSGLASRTHAIRTFPFSLHVKAEAPPRLMRAAQALQSNWDVVLSETDRSEVIKRVILFGFCVGRIHWTLLDGQSVPCIKPWTHANLYYNFNDRSFYGLTEHGEQVRIVDDGVHWVIFTSGGERPWLNGALRQLGRIFFLLAHAYDCWGSYNDVEGTSIRGVRTPEIKREQKEVLELWRVVDLLRGGDTVLLPQGFDLSLITSSARGNAYQTFLHLIDLCNRSIAIVLLGNNLSQEVKGASLAATDAALGQVTRSLTISDVSFLAKPLQRGPMRAWVRANFSPRFYETPEPLEHYAPLPFWDTTEPEDKQKLAETAEKNARALELFAKAVGEKINTLPLDWPRIAQKCGLVLADPETPTVIQEDLQHPVSPLSQGDLP